MNTQKHPFVPQNGIERQFAFICSIAHPSGGERALGEAIVRLAREHGLAAEMDETGNVLVRKCASPGCEGAPGLILQAHLDMVPTKEAGSAHDFARDPIATWVDEGGWLHADGTTLGADDGYGLAYMLDILLGDEGVAHPALECLFTVEEETGMEGAKNFDCGKLRFRRLISLDSGGEGETLVSTAGGERLTTTLPLAEKECAGTAWRIRVEGLTGGHSGEDINQGRANALALLGMLLVEVSTVPGAGLVALCGGEAANAIPRSAQAVICLPEGQDAKGILALGERYGRLFAHTDPGLRVRVTSEGRFGGSAYDFAGAKLMALWPNGVCAMDPIRPDVVEVSDNLGTARIEDGKLLLRTMLRSVGEEWREELEKRMRLMAQRFGAVCEVDSVYPGMGYQPDSKLRAAYEDIVRRECGAQPVQRATHGGMEIGYFARRIPGVDIVTIGCDAEGAHSPAEKMNLASFARVYRRLRTLMAELCRDEGGQK